MQIAHLCEEDFNQFQFIPIGFTLILNIWTAIVALTTYFESANFSVGANEKLLFFRVYTGVITLCKPLPQEKY
jgi:hypothetical protein